MKPLKLDPLPGHLLLRHRSLLSRMKLYALTLVDKCSNDDMILLQSEDLGVCDRDSPEWRAQPGAMTRNNEVERTIVDCTDTRKMVRRVFYLRHRKRKFTERICTGVCTTMSNSFLRPSLSNDWLSPLSNLRMIFNIWLTTIFARLFLFVGIIIEHESGSFRSRWKLQGPGPIKLETNSEISALFSSWGDNAVNKGDS